MRPRVPKPADDDGWVLLTSIAMLSLMVMLAMALLSIVDTQTGQSRQQRVRETAFNLAEAGLNAQIFSLSRDWPGGGSAPYPTCTGTSTSTRCPSDAQIVRLIPTADATGATWQTIVRDNGAPGTASFYSDSLVLGQSAYDANRDGQLWVRATATAQGKTRTMVALVRAEPQEEDIPHAALLTGRLAITNMGNKPIIDASAGGGVATAVVRCTPALGEPVVCLGHPVDKQDVLGKQLTPNLVTTGYPSTPGMTVEARARLKARAIADGTYFTVCPPTLTGAVVYIEAAGPCDKNGNDVFNTASAPGVVVMATGSISLGGTTVFNGVIYHANTAAITTTAVDIQGNARVIGGVIVDGEATTKVGSSKLNIQLSLGAFRAVRSYGSAGVIQNTWREIRPG